MLYDKRWDLRTDTVSEMLWRAADYLRDREFCQKTIGQITWDGKWAVCIRGAIFYANREWALGSVEAAQQRVRNYLIATGRMSKDWRGRSDTDTKWNDRPGRTKWEALEVLMGASSYVE